MSSTKDKPGAADRGRTAGEAPRTAGEAPRTAGEAPTLPDPPAGRRFFCYGCNQKHFDVSICPECGQELGPVPAGTDLLDHTTTLEGRVRPALEDAPEESLVGRALGGYEFEALAGHGGMARVYRGRHLALQRRCALKVLHPRLAADAPEYVEQFLTEARAAAGLVHPNVVTVHNILESEGYHVIEMEWVEGSALGRTLVAEISADVALVTQVMTQVAAGLGAAHERNIVHRDLKPSNVLLESSGVAKLADFGLAKQVLSDGDAISGLAGTPYFMAPELFGGGSATTQSDVYAAGVTYHYLLTGSLPYRAERIREMMRLHRHAEIPDPRTVRPEIPARAVEIIRRCLQKQPELRYPSAEELRRDIAELAGSLRDLGELVRSALRGMDAMIEQTATGDYEVQVCLDGGRRQRVLVERVAGELDAEELIRITTPCAPLDESYLRRALEINGRVDYGALAIQTIDGEPYFVMRSAYPWATCDLEELRHSVLTIASEADRVEEVLVGEDRH